MGVSITTLKNICVVLGISSDRILWSDNPKGPSLDEMVEHLNPEYTELIYKLVQRQIELIAEISKQKES